MNRWPKGIIIPKEHVELLKNSYLQQCDRYVVNEFATVGDTFILLDSPMEHDAFKVHYRRLGEIGIMVPMVDLINFAICKRDIRHTHAGRIWSGLTPSSVQTKYTDELLDISHDIQQCFSGLLPLTCSKYRLREYSDGIMLVEVKHIVDWSEYSWLKSTL